LVLELERIRQLMGGKVALRSSATCEDGSEISMAGVFESVYLDSDDKSMEDAIRQIYEQAQSDKVKEYIELHQDDSAIVEMALVIQELIEPDISGVIYTDIDEGDVLVQYTNGFGDKLVDGITEGSSIVYSPQSEQITKSKNTDLISLGKEVVVSLSQLAEEIRDIFGDVPQDIEFAIEDGQIYILQARTLTTEINDINLEMSREDVVHYTREKVAQIVSREKEQLGSEKVVLSDSNFSELLPQPEEMDFGVFAYIFTGIDGVPGAIQLGRQEMGYPLGDESVGYMHYIGGKPYFSIAGDAHTFYAGFPQNREEYNQTLVKEYLDQIEADPTKGEYPEMGLYLQDPTLDDLTNRYGEEGLQYFQVYQEFKHRMNVHADSFIGEYLQKGKPESDNFIEGITSLRIEDNTIPELVDQYYQVLEHMRNVSCVNFVKSARLGFYYSQRLRDLLSEHFSMDSDEVDMMFSGLNQGLDGSEITEANLKIAQADNLSDALNIGRKVVGHYSSGEMLEIRHPRLKDDEQALRGYVEGIHNLGDQYLIDFEKQRQERLESESYLLAKLSTKPELNDEFKKVMRASQTYMASRETVKYQFTKEYSILRDILIDLSKRMNINEQDVFSLYPNEVSDFIADPISFRSLIMERQERYDKYSLLDLPSVIREVDIYTLGNEEEFDDPKRELFGKLLAQGEALAEAIIVNIEDFETVEAAREVLIFYRNQALPIVLVASQMNLSHDPLIIQSDGLIIENAGLVSHGAQRARELGRGAIGGIKAKNFKTSEHVSFDPSTKKVIRKEK
jgi:phosphohistidine swiveling domain-containing protein